MRAAAARWTAALGAVAVVALGLDAAGLSDATLFAALLVGLALALLAPGWGLHPPRRVATGGQAVIGVLSGAAVQPQTLTALAGTWWAALGTVLITLVLSVVAGFVLARRSDVDVVTGCFAMIAGGASGVTAMSHELGADQRVVAVTQYLRVLLVVSSTPIVAAALPQPGRGATGTDVTGAVATGGGVGAAGITGAGAGWPLDLALTAACVVGGLLLARWVVLPAGSLLWPLLLALVLSATGLSGGAGVPAALVVAAYAVIGLEVGLSSTRARLRLVARVLPLALACIVGLVVGTAAVSIPLLRLAGASTLDAYLASTPGGLYAVLAVSVSSGGDTALVLTVQVLRLVVVVLAAPLLAAVLRRWGPGRA